MFVASVCAVIGDIGRKELGLHDLLKTWDDNEWLRREAVSYYASAGALSMHAARVLDPLSSAHCNITATVALKDCRELV